LHPGPQTSGRAKSKDFQFLPLRHQAHEENLFKISMNSVTQPALALGQGGKKSMFVSGLSKLGSLGITVILLKGIWQIP
jgi:hypothetical protein